MNPNTYPPDNPQTVAAANALSGDRTFMSVQFPCTGDWETDFISGIQTLFAACLITHEKASRVLEYLAQRHASEQRAVEEKEAPMRQFKQMGGIGAAPVTAPPNPYGSAVGGGEWAEKLREALMGKGTVR